MTEPLRLGLLSTARITRHVLAGAGASEAVEVVAVASRDGERAGAFAREHAIPRAHDGYDVLLADPEVEAVYVPLPNSLHVPWTIRALEAGKHVLCEKPLARSAADAERAFDAAERAGLVLAEAFMYRHHPQTARVLELVRDGAIGRLRALRSFFSFDINEARGEADIRLDPELDGGSLLDLGCYCLHSMRLLAGEPERVHAEREPTERGVDLSFHGLLRFPGEVVGQFTSSFALPGRQELEAIGTEGSLLVRAPFRVDWGGDAELRRGDRVETLVAGDEDAYRLELEELARAVRQGVPPLVGRKDAVAQARALEALEAAAAASGNAATPSTGGTGRDNRANRSSEGAS